MHVGRSPSSGRSTYPATCMRHSTHTQWSRHIPSAAAGSAAAGSAAATTTGTAIGAAGRVEERYQIPRSRTVLEGEVGREVVCHVVGVTSGKRGADGADDFLRSVGVMTSYVVHQRGLGEAPNAV